MTFTKQSPTHRKTDMKPILLCLTALLLISSAALRAD